MSSFVGECVRVVVASITEAFVDDLLTVFNLCSVCHPRGYVLVWVCRAPCVHAGNTTAVTNVVFYTTTTRSLASDQGSDGASSLSTAAKIGIAVRKGLKVRS